jgi:hypothetical protein
MTVKPGCMYRLNMRKREIVHLSAPKSRIAVPDAFSSCVESILLAHSEGYCSKGPIYTIDMYGEKQDTILEAGQRGPPGEPEAPTRRWR